MAIRYFNEATSFLPPARRNLSRWLKEEIGLRGFRAGDITFIFCSDEYLLELNKKFLQHDYYTDIITFDESSGDLIAGELYISIDRVRDNACSLDIPVMQELHRVMIHGVLHLCGLSDKTPEDATGMRMAEDQALERLQNQE